MPTTRIRNHVGGRISTAGSNDRWFAKVIYRATRTNPQGFDRATLFHRVIGSIGFKF